MSRPRTTPLARDDSPAAMMAAGVPGEDDDLDALSSSARVAKHRRRAPGRTRSEPVVKHRPAPPTGRQVEPQCPTDASGAWPTLPMPALPLLDLRRGRKRPVANGAARLAAARTLGARLEPGLTVADFLSRLPDRLAGSDLRIAADAIAKARLGGRGVVLGMAAHPIEAGLSPLIVDLMERGVITAVALDGAGVISDFELAGGTGEILSRLTREAAAADEGLGLAVGRHVAASRYPQRALSITAAGARLGIPVTVHVAIGADALHADGAAIGAASLQDFHRFTGVVAGLANGAYVSLGSAVLLAEVFASALERARSLGHVVRPLVTLELACAPGATAATQPGAPGRRDVRIAGHPELLLPLLAAAVIERIATSSTQRR